MGLYDAASAYLYPVLNHASRFVTYCEERGAEAGSPVKTGDMQHLRTPQRTVDIPIALQNGSASGIHNGTGRL